MTDNNKNPQEDNSSKKPDELETLHRPKHIMRKNPLDLERSKSAPIEEITDEIRDLASKMLEDMYATEGCGLAAPQVGELVQLVVIDVDYGKGKKNPYVLVNPRIVVADGEERETGEGCLSFLA